MAGAPARRGAACVRGLALVLAACLLAHCWPQRLTGLLASQVPRRFQSQLAAPRAAPPVGSSALHEILKRLEAVGGSPPPSDVPVAEECNIEEGLEKYYSIDAIFNKCGETCLDPRTYALYKVFEPGLKRAASPSQEVCQELGYRQYGRTVAHGFSKFDRVTLDLYDPTPCAAECDVSTGVAKYFLVNPLWDRCGEACITPEQAARYAPILPGLRLAKAQDQKACAARGYTKYERTVSYGGMLMDMYAPVNVILDSEYEERLPDAAPSYDVVGFSPLAEAPWTRRGVGLVAKLRKTYEPVEWPKTKNMMTLDKNYNPVSEPSETQPPGVSFSPLVDAFDPGKLLASKGFRLGKKPSDGRDASE